jgi:hypothetical protein
MPSTRLALAYAGLVLAVAVVCAVGHHAGYRGADVRLESAAERTRVSPIDKLEEANAVLP